MVIPSFYNSLHDPEVYPEPEKLDPDRWLDPKSSANTNPNRYMVWGAGPHRCIGIEYATMNMMLVLAVATSTFTWEHVVTEKSNEVEWVSLSPFHTLFLTVPLELSPPSSPRMDASLSLRRLMNSNDNACSGCSK
jgi:cytochrome P450